MKPTLVFSLAVILLAEIIFVPIIQIADATAFAWDTTPISATWTTLATNNMILADVNRDGIADAVYTRSGNTLTKQLGAYGVASFTITSSTNGMGVLAQKENRMLAFDQTLTNGCTNMRTAQYNILTGGLIVGQNVSGNNGAASNPIYYSGIINLNNKSAFICVMNTGASDFVVHDTPNVNTTAAQSDARYNPQEMYGNAKLYRYENTVYANNTIPVTGTYHYKTSTNTLGTALAFTLPQQNALGLPTLIVDNQIKFYKNGLAYPTRTVMSDTLLLQRLYHASSSDQLSMIVNLPSWMLNYKFDNSAVLFLLKDSTKTYLGVIQSNYLYYTDYDVLRTLIFSSSRGISHYVSDSTNNMLSRTIDQTMLTNTINVFSLTNHTSINLPYQSTLISGYYYQVPNKNRYYYPEYTATLSPYIPFGAFDSATSALTITVKNAPINGAIYLQNFTLYNTTAKYGYTSTFLQVDHSTTVDLPPNMCFEVFIKDTSSQNLPLNSIGNICNDVSSKAIPYISSLAATFWIYPWGVSHTYNPTTNNLQTIVRHTTTPYTYEVVVKHSNGTVFSNVTYNSLTSIDTQNQNVSAATKPASLIVQGSGTLYQAFLGSPVSLASVSSFFNQYFTIQGFPLLSFIPIIFAAMFTRNTVGVGAVMTVVCIATLSWLSVIVIPDLYISIMMIISLMGLVAYRAYYG